MSWVKSVEYVNFSTVLASGSEPLTKGQIPENCFPLWTKRQATSEASLDEHLIDWYFSAGPVLNWDSHIRTGLTSREHRNYVIEVDPTKAEVKTYTWNMTFGTSFVDIPISSIGSISSAFVVLTEKADDSNVSAMADTACKIEFTSITNVRLTRNNSSSSISGHIFVVRALSGQFTVQHLDADTSGTSTDITISPVTISNAWSIYSCSSNISTLSLNGYQVARITTSTNVNIFSYGNVIADGRLQIIEDSDTFVQSDAPVIPSGTVSLFVPISAIDRTRSCVWLCWTYQTISRGSCNTTGTATGAHDLHSYLFNDTTVYGRITTSPADYRWDFYVIQFVLSVPSVTVAKPSLLLAI